MTKYAPLADHLRALKTPEWVARFAEIEAILGTALPRSAYNYPAWWANQTTPGHSQNLGWRPVGWRTDGLDLNKRQVTFRREKSGIPTTSVLQLSAPSDGLRLSIAQAKSALSRFYDVPEDQIQITIRG